MKKFAPILLLLSLFLSAPDAMARPGDGGHHGPRFNNNHFRGAHTPRVNAGPRHHGPRFQGHSGARHHFAPRGHSPRINHSPRHNWTPRNNNWGPRGNLSGSVNALVGRPRDNHSFFQRNFSGRRHQPTTFMNNFPRRNSGLSTHNFRGDPANYRGAPYQNFRGYNEGTRSGRTSFLNHLPGGNPFPPTPRVTSYNFRGDPAHYNGAPYQNFRGYNGGSGGGFTFNIGF
jgi:hypothetical protein